MKKNFSEFRSFIKGKRTAVVGIGVSNRPLIDFLLSMGAKISAFDKKTEKQLGGAAEELRAKGVELILGENYMEGLKGFEVIFKTPSLRFDHPCLNAERERGAYITSEMEEFVRYCPAKILGVTGSDGKTTTTTLIYRMLKEEGYNTWVGGNIGTPLFTRIEEINEKDRVVLELSSFQLMTMNVSTDVAVVTNLTPNHLDIHKNMEEYIEAKKNIFKFQKREDLLILNRDNDIANSMAGGAPGRIMKFSIKEKINDGACFEGNTLFINSTKVCNLEEITLMGMHNVENLLAAFCAVSSDVKVENMRKVATTFAGVEHRNEFVREIDGVKFYNDAIATSPTRTLAGLNAFIKPVILIAGGYDKKIPFEPLAEGSYAKIKALVLVGKTKYLIKEAFEKVMLNRKWNIDIFMTDTLEESVDKARGIAGTGDIITLSPACASFDMFPNFEAKGNAYKDIVKELK
jgi:UDP-N-acetylmuramoylalanine--D-glutamate ligase